MDFFPEELALGEFRPLVARLIARGPARLALRQVICDREAAEDLARLPANLVIPAARAQPSKRLDGRVSAIHSPGGGKVSLTFRETEDRLFVRVRDGKTYAWPVQADGVEPDFRAEAVADHRARPSAPDVTDAVVEIATLQYRAKRVPERILLLDRYSRLLMSVPFPGLASSIRSVRALADSAGLHYVSYHVPGKSYQREAIIEAVFPRSVHRRRIRGRWAATID